ncbi:uncharacterized protein LOC119264101 [Pygocentrus nattereri]|uniref:uncharacterized protein LOC119264101 n=1 Tax=Pygocentrus nattereri TaxID=42514 RepID=UPI0018910784|nr:uncharacterized protein LOC119264101 [Pygocentrus nattereri]
MYIYLDETEEMVEKHLENEKLKMMAAKAEATDQLMNIYLDNTEDTMEKHLDCEVMSTADTEAEASRLNMQTDLDETGTPTDQPLDTEAEAFKQQLQIHGDKADITEQPLVRCDEMSTADTEAEASRLNMQTHLDETGKPTDQSLDVEKKSDAEREWMFDYQLIKSWADFMEETEQTINQAAEIEALKDNCGHNKYMERQEHSQRI